MLYCCILLYGKGWSKTKLTWQCSSRWCEVIKWIFSSRFFSVFSFTRDPSKISDDLAHNPCPPAEWDLIQQVDLFQSSSCQMTHRTAELTCAARALIGRRPAPRHTATRRDRPHWAVKFWKQKAIRGKALLWFYYLYRYFYDHTYSEPASPFGLKPKEEAKKQKQNRSDKILGGCIACQRKEQKDALTVSVSKACELPN